MTQPSMTQDQLKTIFEQAALLVFGPEQTRFLNTEQKTTNSIAIAGYHRPDASATQTQSQQDALQRRENEIELRLDSAGSLMVVFTGSNFSDDQRNKAIEVLESSNAVVKKGSTFLMVENFNTDAEENARRIMSAWKDGIEHVPGTP